MVGKVIANVGTESLACLVAGMSLAESGPAVAETGAVEIENPGVRSSVPHVAGEGCDLIVVAARGDG